jgi:hypothetical protein
MIEANLKNLSIKMNIKKDGTYAAETTGAPGGQGQKDTGKWVKSGTKITFTDSKGQKQEMTLSKDGATISGEPPAGQGPKGLMTITFKKAK